MKRKIYNQLADWKASGKEKPALLIEGARRVGKSYIAELFGREEYKSYTLIDFGRAGQEVRDLLTVS